MKKEYRVPCSISWTRIIEAESENEAIEDTKSLSPEEIISDIKIALQGDTFEVGMPEEYES